MDQTGCEHCLPPNAAEAWETHRGHSVLMRPVDEPHHSVTVLACPRCGQRFVKVFSETIDWQGGEDPQHWELMPISGEEAGRLMISASVIDLRTLPHRRSLVVDHPKGAELTLRWAEGIEAREYD